MIRFLAAFAACVCALAAEEQLNPPAVEVPPEPPPKPPGPSLVAVAYDARALDGFDENPAVTKPLVDALVRTVAGKDDTVAAWRSLVTPQDRVGIKVTTAGGRYFATRRGIVAAVVAGLRNAGAKEVFVWDKSAAALRDCGFTAATMGCDVRAIEPPKGWDRNAVFSTPILGKLIWGDAHFSDNLASKRADPLSTKSHLATVLSRECTKFINMPALSDEAGCGVAGALHSAVVGNLDNWRRFTTYGEGGSAAIADLYADPRLGGKCALHILDALVVTYAGGPSANPQYADPHASLYASRDPVALDSLAVKLLEQWRADAKLGPIGAKAAWLKAAGIGNAEEKMIQLKNAR